MLVGSVNIGFLAVSRTARLLSLVAPPESPNRWRLDSWHAPVRRFASRTTIFRRAIDDELFRGAHLSDLKDKKLLPIINAADLRTGSAFYFKAKESGSWRLGKLAPTGIKLAHAVTASAAYPLFLPALDEELPFNRRDGSRRVERSRSRTAAFTTISAWRPSGLIATRRSVSMSRLSIRSSAAVQVTGSGMIRRVSFSSAGSQALLPVSTTERRTPQRRDYSSSGKAASCTASFFPISARTTAGWSSCQMTWSRERKLTPIQRISRPWTPFGSSG